PDMIEVFSQFAGKAVEAGGGQSSRERLLDLPGKFPLGLVLTRSEAGRCNQRFKPFVKGDDDAPGIGRSTCHPFDHPDDSAADYSPRTKRPLEPPCWMPGAECELETNEGEHQERQKGGPAESEQPRGRQKYIFHPPGSRSDARQDNAHRSPAARGRSLQRI